MLNKKVTVDSREGTIHRIVSLDELKGLTVPEQFALLEKNGYHRGLENNFNRTFVNEWRMILDADDGEFVAEQCVDLLSTEKLTVPFVLRNRCGVVIDEYNFNLIYYYNSYPARLIAQCWIKGGEEETVFTMPLTEAPVINGFHCVFNDPAKYILTAHDIRCFEERLSSRFSNLTRITQLSNGRFVLATHVYGNGKSWEGFPVCGDGDEAQYKTVVIRYLFHGVDYDASYEVDRDDSMTFTTYEAAQVWANRISVKLSSTRNNMRNVYTQA